MNFVGIGVKAFHDAAMVAAEQAHFTEIGHPDFQGVQTPKELYAIALNYELIAIEEMEKEGTCFEPSYSVLLRSAAALAFKAGNLDKAKEISNKALSKNPAPPSEIKKEIRDVLKAVNLKEEIDNIEERNKKLIENNIDLQFSLKNGD